MRMLLGAITLALCAGCGQTATTKMEQVPQQEVTTPATTSQEQAALGSSVYIYNINAPGREALEALPLGGAVEVDSELLTASNLTKVVADRDGVEVARTVGGYNQFIILTTTTGSTTPSIGAETAQKVSGTQSTSGAQTLDWLQRWSTSLPISVALWGGIADAMAQASSGEGALEGTKTSDQTANLRWLEQSLRRAGFDQAQIAEILKQAADQVFGGEGEGDGAGDAPE